MSTNHELLEDAAPDDQRPRRRLVVVAGIGLLCLLALAAGLFAVVRSGGGSETDETVPEVTFGPEGDATTIPEPRGELPVIQLSVEAGPAGGEVTLQGAGFKAGKGFRPVEVYWDRADGLRLKQVDGPRFSVQLTIPEDAPVARHDIVTVQRTKDGELVTQMSVRFFVTAPRG